MEREHNDIKANVTAILKEKKEVGFQKVGFLAQLCLCTRYPMKILHEAGMVVTPPHPSPSTKSPTRAELTQDHRAMLGRTTCDPSQLWELTRVQRKHIPNIFMEYVAMSCQVCISLVPGAMVIPAPVAYIKVVAVKRLVVGSHMP